MTMENFTPKGIAAIKVILRCMQEAAVAFQSLNADENKACLDFHNEGGSLNHCTRWGLAAAEEIHAQVVSTESKAAQWSVTLTMESKTEIEWSGEADDEDHAEGLAIAHAVKETGEQVFEVVSTISITAEPAV